MPSVMQDSVRQPLWDALGILVSVHIYIYVCVYIYIYICIYIYIYMYTHLCIHNDMRLYIGTYSPGVQLGLRS